ncbi:MAG: Crp/Fnr family transcriptional regulator [Bacteroidia bacterium]
MPYITEKLSQISFLKTISKEDLEQIRKAGFLKEYIKDDIIIAEHSYSRGIPLILKGSLGLYIIDEKDGKFAFLYHLKEGEACTTSISAGIFHKKVELRVKAETDTEVFFIPIDHFNNILRKYPEIFEELLKTYNEVFLRLLQSITHIAFYPLEERLLYLLKMKSYATNSNIIYITHDELAQELGSAREVVTRILHKLEEEKIVKLERGKIYLSEK